MANAILPAYVIYKHCFVITFFFLRVFRFLFLDVCLWYDCNTEVGTMVWSCVVTCLPRECVRSLKLFPLFSRILLDI